MPEAAYASQACCVACGSTTRRSVHFAGRFSAPAASSWPLPTDWMPDRTLTLDVPDKAVGREKLSRVHLWVVPAAIEGLWCGDDGAHWRLSRRHQFVQGHAGGARDVLAVQGRIDGMTLYLGSPQGELWARLDDTVPIPRLQVVAATGVWRAWREAKFLQASGDRCTI